MKIEADKKQTKEIAKDMRVLYNLGGIDAVINKYAKILAYQYTLNKVNFDIYKELTIAIAQGNKNKPHDRRKDT